MYKARKKNRVLQIADEKVDEYKQMGYTILDEADKTIWAPEDPKRQVAELKEKLEKAAIIKYISGYSQSILEDDLVAMRRFVHWDFSGMMQSAKEEYKDIMPVVKEEKLLPEGQLSIFDLFNI